MKKQIAFLLALTMLLLAGCSAAKPADSSVPEKDYNLNLHYDDRITLEEMGYTEDPVIENTEITSNDVAGEKDTAVMVCKDGVLYAVGTGKATLTWGKETYQVTVSPAPLSLVMMTGHSVGVGEKGDAKDAALCPAGQCYVSFEGNTERNLSYSNTDSAIGLGAFAPNRPLDVDNLATKGVIGEIGAIAYQWNKLSGEKIWMLNAAKGGSNLEGWVPGQELYQHAVDLYLRAAKIVAAEVKAGHYTLSHLGILNYSCGNGDQNWDPEKYAAEFGKMREGFLQDLAYDFGDGTPRTVEGIGICPAWWVGKNFDPVGSNAYEMNYGKQVSLWMAAMDTYPELFLACVDVRQWMNAKTLAKYFEESYPQYVTAYGEQADMPETYQHLFADGIHYTQFGYNGAGIEVGRRMYEFFCTEPADVELTLYKQDGKTEIGDSVTMVSGFAAIAVPVCTPSVAGGLAVETTGDVQYVNSAITGTSGTLTFKLGDKVLRTITVNS